MILQICPGTKSYDIVIERGCLKKAGALLPLQRKVLIVTDSGVPERYASSLAAACKEPVICTIGQGESNKTLQNFQRLLSTMLAKGFDRNDCVVAVGGGICGDLAGFAAACYMRGVDFYNIPTTLLSQVDSSIGGKTAVNLDGIKNPVGAFYQPGRVLIDADVLDSLPPRHLSAGLAESLKMAVTFDEDFFRFFEEIIESSCSENKEEGSQKTSEENFPEGSIYKNIEEIILRSLKIKKDVVEKDEKEQGLRKVLNFGHTIGHGIESVAPADSLYHGECVAIGMLPMCSPDIRERLLRIYDRLGLPSSCSLDLDAVCDSMRHDKKSRGGRITVIETDRIGSYRMREADDAQLREKAAMVVK